MLFVLFQIEKVIVVWRQMSKLSAMSWREQFTLNALIMMFDLHSLTRPTHLIGFL